MMDAMIDSCMNPQQLGAEYQKVLADYECVKAQGLNLNMAHGKPAKLQLDLVSDILTTLQTPEDCLIHTSLFFVPTGNLQDSVVL